MTCTKLYLLSKNTKQLKRSKWLIRKIENEKRKKKRKFFTKRTPACLPTKRGLIFKWMASAMLDTPRYDKMLKTEFYISKVILNFSSKSY